MNQNQTSRPPMGGGPMGHGPRGMMIPGGKARDFKGTLQKTIRFMRSSVPVILLATTTPAIPARWNRLSAA